MNQTLSSCSCPLLYHISVWLEPSEPRRGIFFTYVDQADRRAADARCRARVDGGGMGAALEGVRLREAELNLFARETDGLAREPAVAGQGCH